MSDVTIGESHHGEGPCTRPLGGPHVRQEIGQNQSLFGSKGVISIAFWIGVQIWGFLIISSSLVHKKIWTPEMHFSFFCDLRSRRISSRSVTPPDGSCLHASYALWCCTCMAFRVNVVIFMNAECFDHMSFSGCQTQAKSQRKKKR